MKPEAKSLLPYIWILVLFRSCRPWHSHTRSWESWYNWIRSILVQNLSCQKKNHSDSKRWTLWKRQIRKCRKSYCIYTHPAGRVELQQRFKHFRSQWHPNIFQYWQRDQSVSIPNTLGCWAMMDVYSKHLGLKSIERTKW